jgi:hypothetical protein
MILPPQQHDPACGCQDCQRARLEAHYQRGHKAIHDYWGLFLFPGIVAAFIWVSTGADYSQCQSAIVAALSQGSCNTVSLVHQGAGVAGLACLVLFVVAAAS